MPLQRMVSSPAVSESSICFSRAAPTGTSDFRRRLISRDLINPPLNWLAAFGFPAPIPVFVGFSQPGHQLVAADSQ